MQISNLLGKYDQNSIPAAAQEQITKAGTQQLTGSLSSLNVGNIFEGSIRELSGNQVLLMLENGESIAARIEGQIELALNQSMFFEVKSNTGAQIAIKPYLNGNSSNPTLMKALLQAGLGITEEHLEMVKDMMEEQLPIDKQSLNKMARQLAAFPKAEPSTLAQMNKLGIPVTEANIQQFSNYKANAAVILSELDGVLEQIPKSLVQEKNSTVQMIEQNGKMLEILLGEHPGSNEQTIQNSAIITEDGSVAVKNPKMQEAAEHTEGTKQENPLKETLDLSKEPEMAKEAPVSKESIARILSKGDMAALGKQLQALGLEEEMVLKPEFSAKECLEELQKQLKSGILPDKEAITRLFLGKEYKLLLKDAVEKQWFLEPEQVASKENVEKLYDRLQEQMNRLEHAAKQNGMEHEGLQKAVSTVRNNIEFMNEINQIYNFVQMPLKMSGQNVNSELYVYTNKKNLRDPDGELSAFLHLDMDHLGSTDVSVKMKGTAVKTNFYMEDDTAYDLILEHTEELAEHLEKKGYQCQIEVAGEEKSMDFVEDFLKRDVPNTGKVCRYSFDVRA